MARFIFELEPILKHRRAVERQKQLAVAQLEAERTRLENEIRGFQAEITDIRADVRDALTHEKRPETAGVDVAHVRRQASAALGLVARAQRAVLALAGVHSRIDAARLELLAAAKDRRAMEILREQRYAAWLEEQNRRESSMLDELGVIAAARALREEAA